MCNTWDRIRIRILICIKTMPFYNTSCALVPLISFHIKSFLLAEERKNLFSSAIVLMDRVAKDCVHPQKMQQRQRPAQLQDPDWGLSGLSGLRKNSSSQTWNNMSNVRRQISTDTNKIEERKRKWKSCCQKQAWLRRRKIRKHDSEHTCRALTQSLLHAPRGHDGVLHRPDQTRPS